MKSRRIWVTPAGYDDIGAVLQSLGEGYRFPDVDWDSQRQLQSATSETVIFINCSAVCHLYASSSAKALRQFVNCGGIVRASDKGGELISAAFGEYLQFATDA